MQTYANTTNQTGDVETPCPLALRARQSCLDLVDALHLPGNTIDRIIDVLGGKGNVAEMTGKLNQTDDRLN